MSSECIIVTMNRRSTYYAIIAVAVILFIFYFYTTQINKPLYRIRLTNIGLKQVSGVVVTLGTNDIQNLTYLDPGQSYFFYPKPDTQVSTVKVSTNQGIHIQSDFRSPTKVLGLPGAGR